MPAGEVTSVTTTFIDAFLVGDVTTGANTLVVDPGEPFPDTGGIIDVDDQQYTYTSRDDNTLTLDSTTAAALEDGTPVRLVLGDQLAVQKWATVYFLDSESDEPVTVLIPFEDQDKWIDGIYDPPMLVTLSDDLTRITTVPDRQANTDGNAIAPGTIDGGTAFIPGTEPTAPGPTDAPASSPAVKVDGTVEWLILTPETPPDDYALFNYHIRVRPDIADTFVPSAATLIPGSPTRGILMVTAMPDGTPLVEGPGRYEVLVVQTNDIGDAPPGPVTVGGLNPDATNELVVGIITTGFLLTGRIQVGQAYWDADEGLVIPQPGGGAIRFPVDGTQALLDAYVIARGLTVTDDATFMQLLNIFGTARMANGVTDPTTPPGLSFTWTNLNSPHLSGTGTFQIEYRGLVQAPSGTTIASAYWFFGGKIRRASVDGQTWFGDVELGDDWNPLGGITRVSNSYYVLGLNYDYPGSPTWQIRKFSATDWSDTGTITLAGFDPAGRPAIGTDGTDLLIAHSFRNGNGFFIERRTTSGTLLGTDSAVHSLGQVLDASAVSGGTHDYGADRYVIWPQKRNVNDGKAFVYTTANVEVPNAEFSVAGGTQVRGAWWDGTRFRHLDGAGTIWTYGANPVARPLYARYSWRDDNPAGTGTHDTAASPARNETWPPRTMPVIDGRPAPHAQVTDPTKTDKANLVRIYAGTASADCRLQSSLPVGETSHTLDMLNTGAAIAPTVSTFGGAATAPGVWESAATSAGGAALTRADGAGAFRASKYHQSGTAVVELTGATTGTVSITFAVPFDTTPRITGMTNQAGITPNRVSISPTGATLRVTATTAVTATVQIDWDATTA